VGVGDDLGPSDGRCAVSDGLFETSSEVSEEGNLARTVSPLCRPGTIRFGFEGRVEAKEATYNSRLHTNSYSGILCTVQNTFKKIKVFFLVNPVFRIPEITMRNLSKKLINSSKICQNS
jgi:hypothetical protein